MKVKVHTLNGGQSEPIYEGTFPDGFEDAKGVVSGITEKVSSIPLTVGNFQSKETWFNGVHISHAEINLNQAIEVHIDAQSMPVVEMHFALNGRTDIDYRNTSGMPEGFKPLQHNIMYSPGFTGNFQLNPHTSDHRFFEVHLTESYFRELVDEECRVLSSLVTKMERKEMGAVSQRNLGMTTQMTRVVQDMIACQRKGSLQRIYLESKVLELLMLQAEQFEDTLHGAKRPSLQAVDVDKIHHAKALIASDLNNAYSLAELARLVGLNDFKLKKGFKEVFGTTVFGYLHDLRMEQARRMLLDEHKTVGEAADSAGYRNAHHFTAAFKKYFGHLPSELKLHSKFKGGRVAC